jgi:hypothetical protein
MFQKGNPADNLCPRYAKSYEFGIKRGDVEYVRTQL